MKILDDSTRNVLNIVKWFLLATLIGLIAGTLDAIFLKTLDASIAWRNHFSYFYIGLPLALYVVAILSRKIAPADKDYSTDAVLKKINDYQPISFISILKGFTLSIVTMVTGGSAGKEAPCADVGAGMASILGKLFHLSVADQRKLMICGVSAGFAGVFGVPISGALFGLEVLWVGHIFYEIMFPALVAGITSYQLTSFLGVNYIHHPIHFVPVFSEQFFLKMIVAGMFFGLVSLLFIEISKAARVIFRYLTSHTNLFITCVLGGVLLIAIGYFTSPLYLGLGEAGIDGPLSGTPLDSSFGFLYKIITTSITFAAGGIGGIVTPIFFVGAQAGFMFAEVLQVDPSTLAALGVVSVLAGAANTPLSASIMAIELFGPAIAPYAAVSCVISFLITGQQSVYPSQRISLDSGKLPPLQTTKPPLRYGRRATDHRQTVHSHKLISKQLWNNFKHRFPTDKNK